MLFSGTLSTAKCESCGYEHQRVRSTSIMFWLLLVGVAVGRIMPEVGEWVGAVRWNHAIGIVILELFLVVVSAFVVDRLAGVLDRHPGQCPKCGGAMKEMFGGYFDFSFIPHSTDIATAISFGALNLMVYSALKNA